MTLQKAELHGEANNKKSIDKMKKRWYNNSVSTMNRFSCAD